MLSLGYERFSSPELSLLLAGQSTWEYYGLGKELACVFSATQLAASFQRDRWTEKAGSEPFHLCWRHPSQQMKGAGENVLVDTPVLLTPGVVWVFIKR